MQCPWAISGSRSYLDRLSELIRYKPFIRGKQIIIHYNLLLLMCFIYHKLICESIIGMRSLKYFTIRIWKYRFYMSDLGCFWFQNGQRLLFCRWRLNHIWIFLKIFICSLSFLASSFPRANFYILCRILWRSYRIMKFRPRWSQIKHWKIKTSLWFFSQKRSTFRFFCHFPST